MKILFLAYGNPDDPHAWSNVPYLFSKTLREKGHSVISYDIDPNRTLNTIFDKLVCKPLRLINRHHEYRLVRSSLFHWYNNCRLKKITFFVGAHKCFEGKEYGLKQNPALRRNTPQIIHQCPMKDYTWSSYTERLGQLVTCHL